MGSSACALVEEQRREAAKPPQAMTGCANAFLMNPRHGRLLGQASAPGDAECRERCRFIGSKDTGRYADATGEVSELSTELSERNRGARRYNLGREIVASFIDDWHFLAVRGRSDQRGAIELFVIVLLFFKIEFLKEFVGQVFGG